MPDPTRDPLRPADRVAPDRGARAAPAGRAADAQARRGASGPGDRGPGGGGPDPGGNGDPFAAMRLHAAELLDYALHWAQARADQLRASVRRLVVLIALGAVGGVVAILVLGAAVLYLLEGAALGFAAMWGDRLWAGYLTLGALVLALAGGGVWWIGGRAAAQRKQATVGKYEERKAIQRARFGRDARQAAAEA